MSLYPQDKPAAFMGLVGGTVLIAATCYALVLWTNAQFAAFVADTGHVTLAETAPDPADYPGMTPDMVVVAWGKPSEVVTQSKSGDEIWVFQVDGGIRIQSMH